MSFETAGRPIEWFFVITRGKFSPTSSDEPPRDSSPKQKFSRVFAGFSSLELACLGIAAAWERQSHWHTLLAGLWALGIIAPFRCRPTFAETPPCTFFIFFSPLCFSGIALLHTHLLSFVTHASPAFLGDGERGQHIHHQRYSSIDIRHGIWETAFKKLGYCRVCGVGRLLVSGVLDTGRIDKDTKSSRIYTLWAAYIYL
ncbi:hypothetical protein B0T20DRAFT_406436 [Sordaria brevicollis]|uniref:Uncharacterized protein n=1 Tax=Sordaria brevicollis TaxID=83679 RepID=A0AAE0PJW8_SORBR|nr:hypothetical protein B0T20DRAFT_406436 [Sordaria brevicollis]